MPLAGGLKYFQSESTMMLSAIRDDFKGLYLFLKRNRDEAVIIGGAMLFMALDGYRFVWNDWFSSLLYFAILPILTMAVVLRRNPLDLGLRLGDVKTWSRQVAIVCIIATPILVAASFSPSFQSYYKMLDFNWLTYTLTTAASLFASEFFFRGFLIFGLKDKLKESSIFIQMIPFVLVHLGKPEMETISTILTGILFGYIAYKGKSFWPAFIIHMFINLLFVLSINLR